MNFHRMGVLMGGYTLVGLGFVSTILISQRYLPNPAVAPPAVSALATPDLLEIEETPAPKETPKQPVDTAANLDVVLDLLHQEYLNEVNDRALFASSFRLLKEFLATQKVDVKDFPTLPPKIEDRASLTQAWKAMISKVEPKVAGKFDHQRLTYLALKCMLGALKDPYCSVLEPREFRVFEEHMSGGNFSGMGVALVINQGVSTGIAAFFLPIVGNFGYSAMFLFWAACTVIYFITAAFFLPETKGKTLEEIEEHFEGKKKHA